MKTENLFTLFDYLILTITLTVPLIVGIYYAIVNEKTTEDLLVGGRKMRVIPVAASIMVSTVSAISVIGYPAEVYSFGIQMFQITLVAFVCIPISVHLFVPHFYNMRLTSIYEYLEYRFNSVSVRLCGAFMFIFQQLLLSGLVLYAPSIALETFLGLSPWISIIGIGISGTIYTSIGGLKAVVWTDTFQLILMYTGMLAIVIKGFFVVGGVSKAIELASEGGRLNLFDFTFDIFERHNFWNFWIGFGVTYLLQPTMRQHEVQRYSSLPNLKAAKRSVLLSIPIKAIALGTCLFTGLAIYAIHAGCDPIKLGEVTNADQLVPLFVVKELAFMPGMLGLFTACMFCAVLSSYSSSLNGMVAVTWKDFLSKIAICQRMEEKNRARLSIFVGVFYGGVIVTLASYAKHMGGVNQASYAVVGPSNGVLGAVYLMAMFMPFVNKEGALGGMVIGFSSTVFIAFQAFSRKFMNKPLELTISNCPSEKLVEFNVTDFVNGRTKATVFTELEWPEKIYTLSYVLYPALALITTFISGISISLIVRALSKSSYEPNTVNVKYLHPYIQNKYKVKSGNGIPNPGIEMQIHETKNTKA